jgi:hypothetical protein
VSAPNTVAGIIPKPAGSKTRRKVRNQKKNREQSAGKTPALPIPNSSLATAITGDYEIALCTPWALNLRVCSRSEAAASFF